MRHGSDTPPSLDDMEALARAAIGTIPQFLLDRTEGLVIRVQDFPDEETISEMDLEGEFDLLGLYRGVDLARKGTADIVTEPDMVFLYRRPILDYWCETEGSLAHIVRHVLIHEIGHHFGFSDEDMERIERE